MLDSILFYAGALTTAISVFRFKRRSGKIATGVGVAAMTLALAWPAPEKRASGKTHLDDLVPVWEFDERHEIDVAAPPEKVFAAMRAVTADEIYLFHTLTTIRRLGVSTRESIINAPRNEPLLDVAMRGGFRVLADDSPRELVFGSIIERPDVTVAVMNFHVTPNGSGSLLTTETRVHARTAAAARRFAIYWRLIHPGSDIIRRSWLRAIKRRAEAH